MPRKEDIRKLIVSRNRRWQKLKEQQALQGLSTPPEILLEIEDIEAEIAKLQAELELLELQAPSRTASLTSTHGWLTEQKAQVVLDYRRTGVAHCPTDGAILHIIDAGAAGDPYAIMIDCPICQNSFESTEIEPVVKAKAARPANVMTPAIFDMRLQHLADNIQQDLSLLKEYEDILRYEDDPRRRARNRREIEQLRESAARYQREYDELQAQVAGRPPATMQGIATQLQQMDSKLDTLLTGQSAIRDDLNHLRQTLLARYASGEQVIIAEILNRLDQAQLTTVQAVLDALETNRVSETEMRQVLDATQQTLTILQQHSIAVPNQEAVTEVIAASKLDVRHRLKVVLPLLPFIYEGEIELGSGMNLATAWQQLVAKIRGK